jgi:hypothetical protein
MSIHAHIFEFLEHNDFRHFGYVIGGRYSNLASSHPCKSFLQFVFVFYARLGSPHPLKSMHLEFSSHVRNHPVQIVGPCAEP